MTAAKLYDTAYPGSMVPRKEGGYVEADDHSSLAAALVAKVHRLQNEVEDWQAAAIEQERMKNELLEALREIDGCYCEVGSMLAADDRLRHRLTLIKARAAIAKASA
jgi:hypothetical protein